MLDNLWIYWLPIVTMIDDDISASILEGVMDSNCISSLSPFYWELGRFKRWHSMQMQTPKKYPLVANQVENGFIF